MPYAAWEGNEKALWASGSNLASVLHEAIDRCALNGRDLEVTGEPVNAVVGSVIYDVEADTKVDEADPYYPVIVHKRD